jgi:hypothetical protein
MELLVIRPMDAQPRPRQFDGPVSLALALMIAGPSEEVPGFTSIVQQGVVRKCTAYCDVNAKRNGQRVNATATALWHVALKRQGLERGLWRADGTVADWLAGDVVVVVDEA